MYWELGDYLYLAAALEYLALQGERRYPEAQVRRFAAAQSLRRSLRAPLPLGERDGREAQLAAARVDLGEERFHAACAAGSGMSLQSVISDVLESRSLAVSEPLPQAQRRGSRARPRNSPDALTPREREVALLVALDYTDRQIAQAL